VPHTTLRVEVARGGEGLQGEARRARYAALTAWAEEQGIGTICTGHHADDQAETLLMRLQRGSGVGGLAGVRPLRKEGQLLVARPLLGWSKAELDELLRRGGVTAIEDPSNANIRFDRVQMRQFLSSNPQFKADRLARSAASLAEADGALEWLTDRMEAERSASGDGEWKIDAAGLPREVTRRLLARAVAAVRRAHNILPDWTGAEDVEGLLQLLEASQKGTLAGAMAESDGATWRIRAAPPRRW